MNETHDTIDGLLAEFRGYSAGMPPSYHVTMSWADFRKMLDRFDAAYKREKAAIEADALSAGGLVEAMRQKKATAEKSSAVGDASKLREALKQVNELNDLWFDTFTLPDGATSIHDEIENVISAALAATEKEGGAK